MSVIIHKKNFKACIYICLNYFIIYLEFWGEHNLISNLNIQNYKNKWYGEIFKIQIKT